MQNSNTSVQTLTITADADGQRLDNFLLRHCKGAPKSLIYKVIRKGQVRVNRGRVAANYRLQVEDKVRVPPIRLGETKIAPKARHGEVLEQAILYEDDDLIVLNKPSGWAVHGGSGVSLGIIETLRQLRQPTFLELVHRLDKGTSGCLLLAKNRKALLHLQAQLRAGSFKKQYLALLQGERLRQTKVNAPLRKTLLPTGERWVRVDPTGKPSETHFRLVETLKGVIMVEATPITGRTHQIRVHAAFLDAPILGDERYGERHFNREMARLGVKGLCLHAKRIEFEGPSEQGTLVFEAPNKLPIKLFREC